MAPVGEGRGGEATLTVEVASSQATRGSGRGFPLVAARHWLYGWVWG